MGLLVATIGCVFLVGGLLQTIGTMEKLQFFPASINQLWSSPFGFLGVSFTILGMTALVVGSVLAVHYRSHRSWYVNALKERHRLDEEELASGRKRKGKKSEAFKVEVVEPVSALEHVRNRKKPDHTES